MSDSERCRLAYVYYASGTEGEAFLGSPTFTNRWSEIQQLVNDGSSTMTIQECAAYLGMPGDAFRWLLGCFLASRVTHVPPPSMAVH
jgi:hypothetical protein